MYPKFSENKMVIYQSVEFYKIQLHSFENMPIIYNFVPLTHLYRHYLNPI